MIGPKDLVTGLGAGVLLLALALVPGLFQQLVDGVRNAVELLGSPLEPRSRGGEPVETPTGWLLGGGIVLILLTLFAYAAN